MEYYLVKAHDLEDKINNRLQHNKKKKHNVKKNSSNNITSNMLRAIERSLIKKIESCVEREEYRPSRYEEHYSIIRGEVYQHILIKNIVSNWAWLYVFQTKTMKRGTLLLNLEEANQVTEMTKQISIKVIESSNQYELLKSLIS